MVEEQDLKIWIDDNEEVKKRTLRAVEIILKDFQHYGNLKRQLFDLFRGIKPEKRTQEADFKKIGKMFKNIILKSNKCTLKFISSLHLKALSFPKTKKT